MAKQIVPNGLKTHMLRQLIESVTESAKTTYYSFIGDHVSDGSTQSDVEQPTASFRNLTVEPFRNMIFGKRLTASDLSLVIDRNDWVEGQTYAMYDDQDNELELKNYYVVVDESAFKHVYKCLNNANGQPSTSKPLFQDASFDAELYQSGDDYYETADGYQWKYMYSIDSGTFNKFSSEQYIPVVANSVVSATARDGSIDVIKVDENGSNYNNFIVGGQFNTSDIAVGGDPSRYKLIEGAATADNFYANTIIQLTSGPGAGQYRRIVSSAYQESVDGVVIEIANVDPTGQAPFSVDPTSSTTYDISPQVEIISTGEQTANAVARAIINANATNSVHRVEILEPGLNYSFATCSVLEGAPASIDGTSNGILITPTPASVRPILSPPGGHGKDAATELNARAISFATIFPRGDQSAVEATNSFGTFGIIRDPLFANVEINMIKLSTETEGSDGTFIDDEVVRQFDNIKMDDVVSVQESNNIIAYTSNNDYSNYLTDDSYVYIKSDEDVTYNFLSKVTAVSSINNLIYVEDECHFTSANAEIHIAKVTASGIVRDVASVSKIFVRDATDGFRKERNIIGGSSFAVAKISGIDTNERLGSETAAYNFSTYNQMTRLVGQYTSGTFNQDELVYQGDSLETATATGRVHSTNSTSVSLTQVTGNFATNQEINTSGTSQAVFGGQDPIVFNKYEGDLDSTSGTIIYLQNDVPVTRNPEQQEEIRIILEL